jgi:hypothetical protein
LSAPNLVLTSFRPTADGADAVVARMLECSGHYSQAELRCVRDPQRAAYLDGQGNQQYDQSINGDTVNFEVAQSDLVDLRVDF